jgi:ubiquitin-conjugating enzyme E2 O
MLRIRPCSDHLHSINDKVVFRDPLRFPPPSSGLATSYPDGYRVLAVRNCRTTLTILWQDGTRTEAPSTEYEQVPTVDEETDVFPGDVGVFSGVTPNRIGVVQSMDAKKRTIRLRYLDDETCLPGKEEEETVSGLEFDPHGPPPDAYGVRRGDWILVLGEGDKNGAKPPMVPGLGESEIAAGLMPGGEDLRMEVSSFFLSHRIPEEASGETGVKSNVEVDVAYRPALRRSRTSGWRIAKPCRTTLSRRNRKTPLLPCAGTAKCGTSS